MTTDQLRPIDLYAKTADELRAEVFRALHRQGPPSPSLLARPQPVSGPEPGVDIPATLGTPGSQAAVAPPAEVQPSLFGPGGPVRTGLTLGRIMLTPFRTTEEAKLALEIQKGIVRGLVTPPPAEEAGSLLNTLAFAAPPGAIATGGIKAAMREAGVVRTAAGDVSRVAAQAARKAAPTLRELAVSEVGAVGRVTGPDVPPEIQAALRKIPLKQRAAQIKALESSPMEAEQKAARIAILKEGQVEVARGQAAIPEAVAGETRPTVPPEVKPVQFAEVPKLALQPEDAAGPARSTGVQPLVGEQRPVSAPAEAPPLKAPTPPPATEPMTAPIEAPPAGVPPKGRAPSAGEMAPPPPPAPSVGPAVQETLQRARAIVERDKAGPINRILDLIPGAKQVQRQLLPKLGQPEDVRASWIGQGRAEAQVGLEAYPEVQRSLSNLEGVFGKGSTTTRDFKPDVRFLGNAEQAKYPWVGTFYDILQRPSLYALSSEQRAVIASVQETKTAILTSIRDAYGLDIGLFPTEPGSLHLANVDVSDSALEAAGSREAAMSRGRAKERFYATGADRWAHDQTFHPETTISKLLYEDATTLAQMAGKKVFMQGVGGKTRLEVMQELHPDLAAKMVALKNRLTSLRGTLARLSEKQAQAVDDFLASPLEEKNLTDLAAELDPKLKAGKNLGKGIAAIRKELSATKTDLAALRPAWRIANLKPYSFLQEGVYRYFPGKDAQTIRKLLETSQSGWLRLLDDLRSTAFTNDLSPISIQGATAFFSDPVQVSKFVAQGKAKFSQEAILEAIKANPERWQRFTQWTGINPLGGVEREFSLGLTGRIPKIGPKLAAMNDALYRPVTGLQEEAFNASYEAGLAHGLTAEQAAAVAADDATKFIPRYDYRRLGLSQKQAAQYRAVLTSVSFLTQPAAMMTDATKGLLNLALLRRPTRSEVFAMKRVLTLLATVEGIAVTSNVLYAEMHKQDKMKAIKASLNPDSPYFMALVTPWGARVSLGGPFRSMIRAVAPRPTELPNGSIVPMPFAGLWRFATSKLGPTARAGYDEIRNQDYYGKRIRTGEFPVNILQGLAYATAGHLPLTVGTAAQQALRGESKGVIAQEAASQFLGTNYTPFDPVYDAKLRWVGDMKAYNDLPANPNEAKAKRIQTRQEYRKLHPDVDAKLFITGQVESPETPAAWNIAANLMRENGILSGDILALAERPYESKERSRLRRYFQDVVDKVKTSPMVPQQAVQEQQPAAAPQQQSLGDWFKDYLRQREQEAAGVR